MKVMHEKYPDTHHDPRSKTLFGFWIYLLTDFMLFGAIFATYAVLRNSTYGGPSGRELFHLPFTLIQTLLLLICSVTAGFGGAAACRKDKKGAILFFSITFLVGLAFMGMELTELTGLVREGHSWQKSAFLSVFFTLVGTHGLHMVFALLWVPVLLWPVCRYGLTPVYVSRLSCLRMFWQFLNLVWIFIFSIVYLLGV